ncbi:NUDIX hydrolase [Sphingomonadaceae bacterium jetA1]|jgi:ADP-ribose pyrophosphatase|uniref:NUDIX hydrolase n=1 Tax=Facivitalis istanbulensis TaxID=3075838 RepID=UPI0034708DA1
MTDPRMDAPLETMAEGRFLALRKRGTWEYADRPRDIRAAVILAIEDDHILLVEQFRIPLGAPCLEMPAGLIGDETEGEAVLDGAARELEEETGYRPSRIEALGDYCSSPGMTSERFTLVRASGLVKVGEGGGDSDEQIVVHRVALSEIPAFIAMRRAAGVAIDAKMLLLMGAGILGR